MKTELANYLNAEAEKTKALQRAERRNELTGDEKAMLKSILEVIMEDSDLRKGFRAFCRVSVPEMRKMRDKLRGQLVAMAEPKG